MAWWLARFMNLYTRSGWLRSLANEQSSLYVVRPWLPWQVKTGDKMSLSTLHSHKHRTIKRKLRGCVCWLTHQVFSPAPLLGTPLYLLRRHVSLWTHREASQMISTHSGLLSSPAQESYYNILTVSLVPLLYSTHLLPVMSVSTRVDTSSCWSASPPIS